MDRKRITEHVRDVVHDYGPTALAVLRLLVAMWWLDDHGPTSLR